MNQLPVTATVCSKFELLLDVSEFIKEFWHERCEEIRGLNLVGKETGDELLRLQAKYARAYMRLQKHVSSCPLCEPLSRVA
jgi:hypothetical protein